MNPTRGILRSSLFAVLATLLVLPYGCQRTSEAPTPSPTPDRVNLRLKWLVQVHSAGEILADRQGFCEANGLNCEIRPGGPDFNSIRLVATGQDDYGVTSADQLLLAREEGVPIVAIGVLFQESPVCFFARRQEGRGLTPKEFFSNRTVGVKYGTNAETEYAVLLRRAGVDRAAIKEVPVKFDLTPFFQGAVDVWPGIESNEPLAVRREGVEIDVLLSREFGIDTYSNVYFTSEARIRDNPGEVRRFMQAMRDGWQYAYAHPDEAVEAVMAANELLDREHEQEALRLTLPLIFPDGDPSSFGRMTENGWKQSESVLIDGGLLTTSQPVSEAYVDVLGEGDPEPSSAQETNR